MEQNALDLAASAGKQSRPNHEQALLGATLESRSDQESLVVVRLASTSLELRSDRHDSISLFAVFFVFVSVLHDL